MDLNINDLFSRNIMTEDILSNHDVKIYFSGREKKINDKFVLGMLLVPDHRDDIEIVFDLCEKDITEEIYSLMYIRTHGNLKLGYFKLDKPTPTIFKNISKSLDLVETEEELEILKDKITKEIEIRNSKIKKVV